MAIDFQHQQFMFAWYKKLVTASLLGLLIFTGGLSSVFAGDSLYGKVTEVKSANVVTLDYGAGQYDLRLVGIDVPEQGRIALEASQFVSRMVLDKNARMRFVGRTPDGEMLVRLFTDDPVNGIQDVGVELVRAGLARQDARSELGEDEYKYNELAVAEREARNARRGLWTTTPPSLSEIILMIWHAICSC